jgi:1-aminocyclopropane-1-carboxylate deaminase/D-cysteine desulfhydrase-like pyridoxal-dependent ACC family enzyme
VRAFCGIVTRPGFGDVSSSVIRLGTFPTPVQRIDALSREGRSLWVKRDDLTNAMYGGNKVRKLERILEDARGAKRIVTVGAVGSHHVLATAIFAREIGVPVEAVLVPQPVTPHVIENLRADLGLGVHVLPARSYPHAAARLVSRIARGAYYIPVGGSNLLGALAYVDAARELSAQIRAGELPEPDVLVVTLGSGGTAGGLAAGLALEGLATRLVAVTVSDPAALVARTARSLAKAAARHEAKRLGRAVPQVRMEIDARYLGPGYGQETEAGRRALAVAKQVGLSLDLTYTAKTFAATLDLLETGEARNVLYWHTLSSAPLGPWLEHAPAESELSASARALLR